MRDVTIKKKQIENSIGDVNDVMPGSAEDLQIWKKTVSWDSSLEEGSRPVGFYEMCCVFVESVSTELTMHEQSA